MRTVDSVLSSANFWRDLQVIAEQYPQIFVGPDYSQTGMAAGMANAAGLTDFLRKPSDGRHVFDAVATVTGTYYNKGEDYVGTCTNSASRTAKCRATEFRQNYSNQLVVTHGIGLMSPAKREIVSVELGREVFDRYNSASAIRRSCTVNTLAHEWTHTVGKHQPLHRAISVDVETSKPAGVPYLSHLVGAAAQCSWLRSKSQIADNDVALKACAAKFGVEDFKSSQCV